MAEASSSTSQDARTQALELIKASSLEFERSQKLDFEADSEILNNDFQRKDAMQQELDALHAGLQEQNADIGQASLFDNEGFPRSDIDVYNVRLTRVRVIELRNDIKDLSERIRALLEVALARPTVHIKAAAVAETTNLETTAFALVNGVAPGSPAASAGLQRGDRITRFGAVNATNHDNLKAVASEVSKNENRNVTLNVLRKREDGTEASLGLVLTPKTWSGRGLLGCHVVPV